MVPLGGGAREALADLRLLQPHRPREVGDVEQRELEALDAAVVGRLLADAEQQVVADRVQVGGVAGDLQLADDARAVGIGEVDRVERVGLAERDDVADVADEADGVDPLAAAEPADLAALDEVAAALAKRRDLALGLRRPSRPSWRAQDALVLRQRELVEQRARDRAARGVASCGRDRRCRSGGSTCCSRLRCPSAGWRRRGSRATRRRCRRCEDRRRRRRRAGPCRGRPCRRSARRRRRTTDGRRTARQPTARRVDRLPDRCGGRERAASAASRDGRARSSAGP